MLMVVVYAADGDAHHHLQFEQATQMEDSSLCDAVLCTPCSFRFADQGLFQQVPQLHCTTIWVIT